MSLFEKLFQSPIVYVRLKNNEVEVRLVDTDKQIIRKATTPFSNDRLLIAEFEIAEIFLCDVIDELLAQKNKIIKRSVKLVLQPVDKLIKTITPTERRAYLDMAHHARAKMYWLIEHQLRITDSEIHEHLAKNKTRKT